MYNIEIMGVFFGVFVGKWFIYYSLIHLIMTFAIKFIIIYNKVKNQSTIQFLPKMKTWKVTKDLNQL